MLNTAEAARFLRVSQASIRRWADSGRLRVSRVGGRRERRFNESDLLAFMERAPAGRAESQVTVGGVAVPVPGHLATFYTSDAGGMRLSVPFLAEGLRLGQPCVLVATEPLASRYLRAFNGLHRNLTVVAFNGGTAGEAIAEWEQKLSEYVAEGATVIRLVGEMKAERTMFKSEEEMLRYEEAFQLMSKRYPVAVLCQYDVREFDGLTLVRALKAHPDMFELRIGAFLN
ncbi:MAG: helix-turn-helix domain-containing protein [Chloroflexi bacterium]|nr:MAG: helix-turn-helix domain-containing protein [Chloroflexota bacterium]